MRQIEQAAFDSGVDQPNLMRQAGRAVANRVLATLKAPQQTHALVLVGPGNNGGDGLVVAERYSKRACAGSPSGSIGAKTCAARRSPPICSNGCRDPRHAAERKPRCTTPVAEADLIVDALYGIGGRDELPHDSSPP